MTDIEIQNRLKRIFHTKKSKKKGIDLPMREYLCRRCKTGLMVQQATAPDEMESSDTYVCKHCGHAVTLPSMLMIISQLVSGLASGLFAAYLFIEKLSVLMTAMQFGSPITLGEDTGLLLLALSFLIAGGFILYQAFSGLSLRKAYQCLPSAHTKPDN